MPEPNPVTTAGPHEVSDSRLRRIGPALATTVIPFALVVYLALNGGGYDDIVRGEVGFVVWWIVLLGAIAGLLPVTRISRAGWVIFGLLAAFGAWTALALFWTESTERTVLEIARVASYLGIFALALCIQREEALRRTVASLAAACGLIGVLALLSRLHPSWFPHDTTADFLTYAQARLNYPLDYWNGLAYLVGIGIPLLLSVATRARTIAIQSVAAATVPLLVLTCFFTISRGGAIALMVGIAVFVALHPRRIQILPTLILVAVASGLLIVLATQRDALENNLGDATAHDQGTQMLVIGLVVAAVVGLLQAGIAVAQGRGGLGSGISIDRRRTQQLWGAVAIVAIIAMALFNGKIVDKWDEFKSPSGPAAGDTTGRFESASGNGRYQWWEAAVDANSTAVVQGIGPGTFEFYWAREGSIQGFVRDAHSLYLESLAELGLIGAALILAFVFGVLALGALRTLRMAVEERPWAAGATAACAAFAVAAAFDWVWEMAVLPAAFLFLAAALLYDGGRAGDEETPTEPRDGRPRFLFAGAAVLSLIVIGFPLAGSLALRSSQDAANDQDVEKALSRAQLAADLEPWAASPKLQEALVLELEGDYAGASASALDATDSEPTNWRNWFILSRVQSEQGDEAAAAASLEKARSLNPRSPLFAQ